VRFVLRQSRQHLATIKAAPHSAEEDAGFAQMAEASIAEQRQIEASDNVPFEIFRKRYLSPERLGL
jgi:glutamate--cysteine ligase